LFYFVDIPMLNSSDKPRLIWACRRGMLELDVILTPFVEHEYDGLEEAQRATFRRLLECDDPDLFAWFMGHDRSRDAALQGMVEHILERNQVRNQR
jgi:antitoxin CptB